MRCANCGQKFYLITGFEDTFCKKCERACCPRCSENGYCYECIDEREEDNEISSYGLQDE